MLYKVLKRVDLTVKFWILIQLIELHGLTPKGMLQRRIEDIPWFSVCCCLHENLFANSATVNRVCLEGWMYFEDGEKRNGHGKTGLLQ